MLGDDHFPKNSSLSEPEREPSRENGLNGAKKLELGENFAPSLDKAMPSPDLLMTEEFLRPEQAEALLTISTLLSSELNPGAVLRNLLQHICSLFRADRSAVFLRKNLQRELTDPAGPNKHLFRENEPLADIGPVVCAANYKLSDEYISKIITFYEDKEFSKLQEIRRPVFVADAQHDVRLNGLRELNQHEGFQTMLTLPLLYRQNLIGILVLYHNQRRIYSDQELKLLTVFSNQAALSITNARLYDEARRREREAQMLAEASRLFNTSLKVRNVVPNVVTVATNMLANTAVVYILRENTDQLYPIGYISQLPQPPDMPEYSAVKHGKPMKVGQTAIGKVVQTGTPILMREADLRKTPLFLRAEDGVESFLCVPLRVRGRIIGALASYNVTFHQKNIQLSTLEERHVAVAQALADRAAIAIENAQMYEAEIREQSSKDEFLSLVAHELRTPITSIKGYNRLIIKRLEETEGLEPGQYNLMDSLRHYTGAMDTQVERLHVLIEDLTRISEIETERVELHKRSIDLVSVVRNKVAEMEKQLKAARLPRVMHSFEIRAYPDLIMAEVDVAAFERVVFSILGNAVKFSPKGGAIKIRIQQALDEVTVSVQDEGVGISADDRLKIFERFYKSTNHGSRANGLGLGLYISQGLMKAMGGRIEVESEEGNGSTFTIFVRK